tara:strand:+ start:16 stop:252 length:237 start_codon:yes stop_codon:yes gene_type:complete
MCNVEALCDVAGQVPAEIVRAVTRRCSVDLESLTKGELVSSSTVTSQKLCSSGSPIPPSGRWGNGKDIDETRIANSAS